MKRHDIKIDKLKLGRTYDRRVKLTEADKERMKSLYAGGMGVRAIAREYEHKCSRRMVQFVIFPERLKQVQAQYKERRKDGRYYNKENHTKAIRKVRALKVDLYEKGLIKL